MNTSTDLAAGPAMDSLQDMHLKGNDRELDWDVKLEKHERDKERKQENDETQRKRKIFAHFSLLIQIPHLNEIETRTRGYMDVL
jgi:hypothetical protein